MLWECSGQVRGVASKGDAVVMAPAPACPARHPATALLESAPGRGSRACRYCLIALRPSPLPKSRMRIHIDTESEDSGSTETPRLAAPLIDLTADEGAAQAMPQPAFQASARRQASPPPPSAPPLPLRQDADWADDFWRESGQVARAQLDKDEALARSLYEEELQQLSGEERGARQEGLQGPAGAREAPSHGTRGTPTPCRPPCRLQIASRACRARWQSRRWCARWRRACPPATEPSPG